jgi:polysaccharide biosynthesis protein PslH
MSGSGTPRLRVLVVDEAIPYPPNAGKSCRTWNLLRRLAARHSVCLLCYGHPQEPGALAMKEAGMDLRLVDPKKNPGGVELYLQLFLNLFSPFPFSVTKHYSRAFQTKFEELLNENVWDLIQCEWTPYARFVARVPNTPILITTHNVESQIWARSAEHARNPFAKAFFRTQQLKMLSFEKRALRRASAATAVTNLERSILREWGVKNVSVIPNGVAIQPKTQPVEPEHENELLFLASLDWHPNLDALDHFVNDIFPSVRKRRPAAKLRIVGRKPSESTVGRYSHLSGVNFVGEVQDVTNYIARATAIVVPLRIGGGSRIKILEALAASKAVISTSIGAEGLELTSGEHLLIADSPVEFAKGVEELLASADLRRRLGSHGRKFVADRYDWDQVADQLESVWYEVSRPQTAPRSVAASSLGLEVSP